MSTRQKRNSNSSTNKTAINDRIPMTVEDEVIHELSTLIQKSGDKMLKDQTKLVLTLPVLNCVNRKLRLHRVSSLSVNNPTTDDDIVPLTPIGPANCDIWLGLECRNAEDELTLVDDFFKRLATVKVTQGHGTVQGSVDMSHFECLKVLELKRVPIHLIIGLQSLRPHLKLISCSHYCLQNVEDLLESCGGDRCSPFAWTELLSATLTHNTIHTVGSSLRLLPALVSLDLSHNQISDTRGLEFLTELQFLNLSHNQLQHLPVLGTRARLRMKVLSVRNNSLETLEGIDSFYNLQQADLAFNCLLDHCNLAPFLSLPHIVLICLEGNPISSHDKHRILTANHLHKGSLLANCTVDGKPLTNAECTAVNRRGSNCRTWKHASAEIYVDIPAISAVSNRPLAEMRPEDAQELSSSVLVDSGVFTGTVPTDATLDEVGSRRSKLRSKKKPLIREVSIADDSTGGDAGTHRMEADVESIDASESMYTAKDEMERFRQQHGKEWLIVGSKLKVLTPVTIDPNDPAVPQSDSLDNKQHEQSQISDDVIVLDTDSDSPAPNHENSTDVAESSDRPSEDHDQTPWKKQDDESTEEDSESDDAVLPLFIVQMEKPGVDSSTTILVVVSDRDLCEKDALTGRTTERLDLRSICSVQSLAPSIPERFDGSDVYPRIKMGFSYVRKDRRERIYTMEDVESHKQFLALIKPLVDAKTLEEITSGALQCLKCSSQFSKEVAKRVIRKSLRPPNDGVSLPSSLDTSKGYLSEADACPNCSSEMIIEIHEQNASLTPYSRSSKSGDTSRLSTFESSVQSNVTRRTAWDVGNLAKGLRRSQSGNVRERSRRSSSCNIVQVEVEVHACRSNDDAAMTTTTMDFNRISSSLPFALRRSGSDITILSNPSQSSIMVVPSSQNLECANLDVISETNSDASRFIYEHLPMSVETIGSGGCGSSGSLTSSSACTALEKSVYDRNLARTPDSFRSALSGKQTPLLRSYNNSSDCKRYSPSASGESIPHKENSSNRLQSPHPPVPVPPPTSSSFMEQCNGEKSMTWSCSKAHMEYSFSDFGDVDHRLRLYFDMHVFGENEELVAVLRANIIPYVTDREFQGLLVVSRTTVHILRIIKQETDEPQGWLQKYESKPLAMLFYLNIRLGNQGFQLEFGPKTAATCFTFLLRDADNCNNFVTFFLEKLATTLEIPDGVFQCGLDGDETLQILQLQLLPWRPNGTEDSASDEVPLILYLMCYWRRPGGTLYEPVSLVMTSTDIYVFREDLHWPIPHLILPSNEILCRPQLTPINRRAIQDLTSLEQSDPNSLELTLTFMDDDTHEEASLHVAAETAASVLAIVNALKEPWEKLFGVNLPVNVATPL